MRVFATAAICTFLLACGNLSSAGSSDGGDAGTGPDGGPPPGDSGSGSDSGGPGPDSGSQGGDSGSPGDSGSGNGDSGTVATPPLTWSQLPEPSPIPYSFTGVGGTPAGAGVLQLYVGADADLDVYSGGNWTLSAYHQTSNFSFNAIWVSDAGAVYGGGDQFLVYCPGNCTSQAAFTTTSINESIEGICTGDGSTIYATGYDSTGSEQGALYQYNSMQQTWTYVYQDTQTQDNWGCWVDPNGVVYMAANAAVARYDSSGGGLTVETLTSFPPGFPVGDQSQTDLRAVWGYGSTIFAAGNSRLIFQRNSTAGWDFVFHDPTVSPGGSHFYAMAGSGSEGYAAGDYALSWNVARYTPDSGWVIDQSTGAAGLDSVAVSSMWSRAPNEYYAVGALNGGNAVLFSGTR
jgi:hypothetical protein